MRGFWAGGAIGYELTLPVTTLAAGGIYYRETLDAWDESEAKPTGLAGALFDAVLRLQYSGSLDLGATQECNPAEHHPGYLLGICGSAWSAMKAPIYQVSHEITSDRKRLDFGPSPNVERHRSPGTLPRHASNKPDAPELDPDEEPEPIEYRANSVNRAMQGGSADGGTARMEKKAP